MRLFLRGSLFFLLLVASVFSCAVFAGSDARVVDVGLLHDASGRLVAEEVAAPRFAIQFVTQPDIGDRVIGYTTDALWLRFRMVNDADVALPVVLQVGIPRSMDVRLYERDDAGAWQEHRSGLAVPVVQREVVSRYPAFPVTLAPREQRQMLARVTSGNAIQLQLQSWSPEQFRSRDRRVDFINALQFGAIFLLAIYGVVLFFGTRDRTYFYFAFLLAAHCAYDISFYQYGYEYLWPSSPQWALRSPGFFFALTCSGACFLISRLLQTRQFMRRCHVLLRVLGVLSLLLALAILVFPYATAVQYVNYLAPVVALTTMCSALLSIARGYRPARILFVAFLFVWITSLMRTGAILGLFPVMWFADYVQSWSVIFAGLLMATSLAGKVQILNIERMNVQWELLRAQVTERGRLETEVHLRTTELRDAKEKAEEADAAKSRFLAQLSHELRTPLHSVLGNTGLMLGEPRGEDDVRRLNAIQRSGRHLLALIEEVLEFVRGDTGHIRLVPRPVWLRELLQGVLDEMRPLAQASDTNLLLQIEADVPDGVSLDAMRVRQVLLNLVGNACRHSRGEVVSLQVHLVERRVDDVVLRFEVHDDGEGIDENERAALFDPFWQSASADRRSGLGLGLPISRQWVRLMGGDIEYEARATGGSLFRFVIPVPLAGAGKVTAAPEKSVKETITASSALASGTWRTMPTTAPADLSRIKRPSEQAVARLRLAAGLGLITDIGEWARHVEESEPQAAEFVALVRSALARVDLAAIRRLAGE